MAKSQALQEDKDIKNTRQETNEVSGEEVRCDLDYLADNRQRVQMRMVIEKDSASILTTENHDQNKENQCTEREGCNDELDGEEVMEHKIVTNQHTALTSKNLTVKKHQKQHQFEPRSRKLHRCPHCSYSCKRADHLKRHIQTHTGDKQFICKQCQQCFAHKSSLSSHIRKLHSTDHQVKIFQCPHCPYSTKYSSTLQRHIRTHTRLAGEELYSSKECRLRFAQPFNLSSQMQSTDQLQFQCPYCPYSTEQDAVTFQRHVCTHTGKKPYYCKECGQCFTKSCSLDDHMRWAHSATE